MRATHPRVRATHPRVRTDRPGPAQEVSRLLAASADINTTDNAGLVPLHIAAGEGAADAVRRAQAAAAGGCPSACSCSRPRSRRLLSAHSPPLRRRPSVSARAEQT